MRRKAPVGANQGKRRLKSEALLRLEARGRLQVCIIHVRMQSFDEDIRRSVDTSVGRTADSGGVRGDDKEASDVC